MAWAGDNYPQEYVTDAEQEGPTDEQMDEPCWPCAEPVMAGYRVTIGLIGVEQSAIDARLCYPCFRTVDQIFGVQGGASLRRADRIAALGGS